MSMAILWKIHYLDLSDKKGKFRNLFLDTRTLDPIMQAKVELLIKIDSSRRNREILKYRHLFREFDLSNHADKTINCHDYRCISLDPEVYCEDETGKEISASEIGQILAGNPRLRLISYGAKQHDIELISSERKPLPVSEVSLTTKEIRSLSYFSRDLRKLIDSTIMNEGPGTLKIIGNDLFSPGNESAVETAATEEDIRSFLMTFRPLAMLNDEPGKFLKAVAIFVKAIGDHPYAKWVDATADNFTSRLGANPEYFPLVPTGMCNFDAKFLINAFFCTQSFHQPSEIREADFNLCLQQVNGKISVLIWLLLNETWKLSIIIINAGRVIAKWFEDYCTYHKITPNAIDYMMERLPGIGAKEKEEERQKRLFLEQVEKLAIDLWKQANKPIGGYNQFLAIAGQQLQETC